MSTEIENVCVMFGSQVQGHIYVEDAVEIWSTCVHRNDPDLTVLVLRSYLLNLQEVIDLTKRLYQTYFERNVYVRLLVVENGLLRGYVESCHDFICVHRKSCCDGHFFPV